MEYIIYHKADLDGMASAAIFYNNQVMYGENAKLFPYDYGQKLDTRLFKGKSAVMVDVSMDMERMELLGNSCLEFIWIDHHISAFNKLFDYCQEKEYGIVSKRINDLTTMVQVQKMNLTYYFSKQISACEISAKLFPGNMGKKCAEIINTLGQYDTWRNTEEAQLFNDKNWELEVIPVQYGLRSFSKVEDLAAYFNSIDKAEDNLKNIIEYGKKCFSYQQNKNKLDCLNKSGEYLFEGLKIVALNTTNNSSQTFDGFYFKEIHDAMMTYSFNAKINSWNVSLYTTKDDVDILSIAKKYDGGGHQKACGFNVPFNLFFIDKNEIKIESPLILDIQAIPKSFSDELEGALLLEKIYRSISFIEDSKIEKDVVIKGTKQVQDHRDKWYYIPNIMLNDFTKSVLELSITSTEKEEDLFLNKYMKYGNENYQKNKPSNHWKK